MKYYVAVDGTKLEIELAERNGRRIVRVNGAEHSVDFRCVRGRGSYSLLLGDRSHPISFDPRPDGLAVTVESEAYLIQVEDERQQAARALTRGGSSRDTSKVILSMMPGIVREIRVAPGEEVEAGQPLLILEAMKMENEIRAVMSGTVKTVHVRVESTVNKGDPLVTLA